MEVLVPHGVRPRAPLTASAVVERRMGGTLEPERVLASNGRLLEESRSRDAYRFGDPLLLLALAGDPNCALETRGEKSGDAGSGLAGKAGQATTASLPSGRGVRTNCTGVFPLEFAYAVIALTIDLDAGPPVDVITLAIPSSFFPLLLVVACSHFALLCVPSTGLGLFAPMPEPPALRFFCVCSIVAHCRACLRACGRGVWRRM